ncbi:MAG: hypothetical protein F7C34_01265 [Desulfurococcales archaeon]|nr:hypothetical protein [Desulfurococcales archaeon]
MPTPVAYRPMERAGQKRESRPGEPRFLESRITETTRRNTYSSMAPKTPMLSAVIARMYDAFPSKKSDRAATKGLIAKSMGARAR